NDSVRTDSESASTGVHVHAELGTFSPGDLRRVGRLLNDFPTPRRVLVQWVPHGYGYRSVNIPMALWLAGRGLLRGDTIDLFVHEAYSPLSAQPAQLAAALGHRAMLTVVAAAADRIWISIPAWEPVVRPYAFLRPPIQWLPVPA